MARSIDRSAHIFIDLHEVVETYKYFTKYSYTSECTLCSISDEGIFVLLLVDLTCDRRYIEDSLKTGSMEVKLVRKECFYLMINKLLLIYTIVFNWTSAILGRFVKEINSGDRSMNCKIFGKGGIGFSKLERVDSI